MGELREQKAANETFLDVVESWVRRQRHGIAVVALVLFVALAMIGVGYDGNLVWINRLEHPFVFGGLVTVALTAAWMESIPWHRLRFLIGLAGYLAILGGFIIGLFWFVIMWLGGAVWPVATVDAPADSGYQAVVYEQHVVIDKLWTVYIQQTRGLLSREWWAGCISNDVNADPSIEGVRWQGPRQLFVVTATSGIFVSVDPRTGKPKSPTSVYARDAC
jgi:hypothetical protein